MAELTITAANIIPVSGYREKTLLSASAITQGQAIYINSSNQWAIADADAAATATTPAIALNEATAANQPVQGITGGDVGFGAILTANEVYCCSADTPAGQNAGGIIPLADLSSGDFLAILGVATTTSNLHMLPYATAVAKA